MNEVNEQSLPVGRLGGVVEFIPDEFVQISCHLPFLIYLSSEMMIYRPGISFVRTNGSDK
jgi:hypothetical protein